VYTLEGNVSLVDSEFRGCSARANGGVRGGSAAGGAVHSWLTYTTIKRVTLRNCHVSASGSSQRAFAWGGTCHKARTVHTQHTHCASTSTHSAAPSVRSVDAVDALFSLRVLHYECYCTGGAVPLLAHPARPPTAHPISNALFSDGAGLHCVW
jgi:hypothetical protein